MIQAFEGRWQKRQHSFQPCQSSCLCHSTGPSLYSSPSSQDTVSSQSLIPALSVSLFVSFLPHFCSSPLNVSLKVLNTFMYIIFFNLILLQPQQPHIYGDARGETLAQRSCMVCLKVTTYTPDSTPSAALFLLCH